MCSVCILYPPVYFILSLVSRYFLQFLFRSLSPAFRFHAKLLRKNAEGKRVPEGYRRYKLHPCTASERVEKAQPQFLPRVVKFRFWKREGKGATSILPFSHHRSRPSEVRCMACGTRIHCEI